MAARPEVCGLAAKKPKLFKEPKDNKLIPSHTFSLDPSLLEECKEIEDCILGEGRFGEVKLMKYRSKLVAVKRMKDNKYKYLIEKEAEILRQLGDHPGLPYIYGVCEKAGEKMLILEYSSEETTPLTLNEAIQSKKVECSNWKNVIELLAKTMCYMHTKGIIHGDMKGDNVLLIKRSEKWCPIVIDFGKCIRITTTTTASASKIVSAKEKERKYPHIAPEVIRADSPPSIMSDAYSFGRLATRICKNFESCRYILEIVKKCYIPEVKSRLSIQGFLRHVEKS